MFVGLLLVLGGVTSVIASCEQYPSCETCVRDIKCTFIEQKLDRAKVCINKSDWILAKVQNSYRNLKRCNSLMHRIKTDGETIRDVAVMPQANKVLHGFITTIPGRLIVADPTTTEFPVQLELPAITTAQTETQPIGFIPILPSTTTILPELKSVKRYESVKHYEIKGKNSRLLEDDNSTPDSIRPITVPVYSTTAKPETPTTIQFTSTDAQQSTERTIPQSIMSKSGNNDVTLVTVTIESATTIIHPRESTTTVMDATTMSTELMNDPTTPYAKHIPLSPFPTGIENIPVKAPVETMDTLPQKIPLPPVPVSVSFPLPLSFGMKAHYPQSPALHCDRWMKKDPLIQLQLIACRVIKLTLRASAADYPEFKEWLIYNPMLYYVKDCMTLMHLKANC